MSARDSADRESALGRRGARAVAAETRRARRAVTPLKRGIRGVTSIEYALLGALIAVVIFLAVQGVGGAVANLFGNVATCAANMFQGC